VLLLSGLLNAGYFFPIVVRAYFRPSKHFERFDEALPSMLIPLLLTAAFAVLLGIYPDGIFHFYSLSAEAALGVVARGAP